MRRINRKRKDRKGKPPLNNFKDFFVLLLNIVNLMLKRI